MHLLLESRSPLVLSFLRSLMARELELPALRPRVAFRTVFDVGGPRPGPENLCALLGFPRCDQSCTPATGLNERDSSSPKADLGGPSSGSSEGAREDFPSP